MTPTAAAQTGTRSTQGLIVPTTQNTAPVLDFRCLYTYDLRRKQKRWQDGLLRYHTFNKRIMVYDVPRNYIGDTHWRDEGIVGDGDEFELDRGVLIQVGEATGSMDQDLTELLEKRKKPRDVVSGQTSSSPTRDFTITAITSPVVAQTPLLKPKSLNALLGTPKGPIGRASLSKRSPHEMRDIRNDMSCNDERPMKRLRMADSNAVVSAPVISQLGVSFPTRGNAIFLGGEKENFQGTHVSRDGEGRFSKSRTTDSSSTGGQQSYTAAAQMAHETLSAVKPRAGSYGKSTRTQREHEPVETRPKVGTSLPRSNEVQPRLAAIAGTGSSPDSLTSSKEKAAESVQIISDVEVVSSSEPRKKKMKLQMASRKPRKKLMYRDLLPQDPPAIKRSSSSTECTASCGRATAIPSRSERRPKEPLTEFHERQPDRLADRLNRHPGNNDSTNANHKSNDPSKTLSPSLFLTQEDSDSYWTERHRTTDDSSNTRNLRSIEDTSEEHPNPTPPAQALKAREPNIPKASSTVHDTELTLTKMDEIRFSRSQSKAPLPRKAKEPVAPVSPTRISSPSRIPSTLKDFPPSRPPDYGAPPTKSLNISPTPKRASPAPPPELATHSERPITAPPTHPQNPHPKPRPLKPPKPHPPLKLKQTISDPSDMHAPPPLQTHLQLLAHTTKETQRQVTAKQNANPSAWGPEAWDLFGCGRDGVACSYEEFKRKEGLM